MGGTLGGVSAGGDGSLPQNITILSSTWWNCVKLSQEQRQDMNSTHNLKEKYIR